LNCNVCEASSSGGPASMPAAKLATA